MQGYVVSVGAKFLLYFFSLLNEYIFFNVIGIEFLS